MKIITLVSAATALSLAFLPVLNAADDISAAVEKAFDKKKIREGTTEVAEYIMKVSALGIGLIVAYPEAAEAAQDPVKEALLTAHLYKNVDGSDLPEDVQEIISEYCEACELVEAAMEEDISKEDLDELGKELGKAQKAIEKLFKEYGVDPGKLAQAIAAPITESIQQHVKENGPPENEKEALALAQEIYSSFIEGMEEADDK